MSRSKSNKRRPARKGMPDTQGKGGWDANPKVPSTSGNSSSAGDAVKTDAVTASKESGTDSKNVESYRATNDPEWYSKDNQLVIDAGSLPFSDPLGDPIPLFSDGMSITADGKTFKTDGLDAFPGILTMFTKSSFGTNTDIKSPLNVAAQALYTHVRYMNSGRKNYDPADLMMYVISMADVYSFLVWCERIYAKAFVYSQRNKYVGAALLNSENIDKDDIIANLANFRYWINSYINKISSYAIPKDLAYFSRRVFMYSALYIENPDGNIKDQLYQFSPDGFYRFQLDSETSAGCLRYHTLTQILHHSNKIKFSDLISIGNYLLANVTGDEDFGLMSGDIIKAFNGNILGLTSLPEVVDIIPIYSEYVLLQFHNATVIPVVRGNEDADAYGDVMQNANNGLILTHEGVVSSGNTAHMPSCVVANMNKLLDVKTPQPNPIDVMEASRLMVQAVSSNAEAPSGTSYWDICSGADIATYIEFCYYTKTGSLNTQRMTTTIAWYYNNAPTDWAKIIQISKMGIFKYAPLAYYAEVDSADDTANVLNMHALGNVNNYTVVHENTLQKLHEVAMLSLLSVPGVAKLVNVI